MKLHQLFEGAIHSLDWYIDGGLISQRKHPDFPLAILNYTEKCVYSRHWDLVTRRCRGLIYWTDTFEVAARPFEKFFNLNEPDAPVVGEDVTGTAYDKVDGSLGILYDTGDTWAVASRGSFTSDQAWMGTKILQETYLASGWRPHDGWTYLFEIIYPDNRVVLDYGDTEDLILLDILDIDSGRRMYDLEWPGPRVEVLAEGITLGEATQISDRENREGVVWVQDGPYATRVKLKQEDYVRKHRIVYGLNARMIWEMLSENKVHDIQRLIMELSQEFAPWAESCEAELRRQYSYEIYRSYKLYDDILYALQPGWTRKEFANTARKVAKNTDREDYFLMTFLILDGDTAKLSKWCWNRVYPSADWRPTTNNFDEESE